MEPWIYCICVREDFRGKGVFSRILKQLLELLAPINPKKLKLVVEEHNQQAVRAYHGKGFTFDEGNMLYSVDLTFDGQEQDFTDDEEITPEEQDRREAAIADQLRKTSRLSFEAYSPDQGLPEGLEASLDLLEIPSGGLMTLQDLDRITIDLDWSQLRPLINQKVSAQFNPDFSEHLKTFSQLEEANIAKFFFIRDKRSGKILGSFSMYMEVSEWRSGKFTSFINDFRLDSSLMGHQQALVKWTNLGLLDLSESLFIGCLRWMIYDSDESEVLKVLQAQKFNIYNDLVMQLIL